MEIRIDLGELRLALARCKIFWNAVGTINPRPPGLHNDLIQHLKKLMSRTLAWYIRPQREFNSSVVRPLTSSLVLLKTSLMETPPTRLEYFNPVLI
jgi:hypothetical protein